METSDDKVRHFVVLHCARHFAGFGGRSQAIDDAALQILENLRHALAQRFAMVARLGGEVAVHAAMLAAMLMQEAPVHLNIRADAAERGELLVAQRFADHLAAAGVVQVQRLQGERLL